MIKIIMHGCNGKMGQVITKIAEADSKVEIVAGVDQFQCRIRIRCFHRWKRVMQRQT